MTDPAPDTGNPPAAGLENPFVDFLRRFKDQPVDFVRNVLGAEPDEWQAEFLRALARGERRISIRSGHGVGKSTAASWAAEWFLLTRFPCKVVITAPTSAQLFDALFSELKAQVNRLPPALRELLDVTSDRICLRAAPESAFVSARTSSKERPESLAGVHSEHVLLIADEASGIPEEVFEAAAGSMSGENATTILLGNPIRGQGFFYRTHTELSADWWTRRVSCLDSRRVSPDFVAQMRATYGDSNAYRTRVLGEFPTRDDDSLIDRNLVESAMSRDVTPNPAAPLVWGLDVARFGSDSTCLVARRGAVVLWVKQWRNLDLMQTCGCVVNEYNTAPSDARPAEICIDAIGLGAGVADRLREMEFGSIIRDVNVSESSGMNPTASRLRDDLWMQVKSWLEKRDCSLPKDEALAAELTAPTYTFTSSGKLVVESKDSLRRRGVASPDRADALCLTFAGAASLVSAGPGFRARQGPIRRNLAVV